MSELREPMGTWLRRRQKRTGGHARQQSFASSYLETMKCRRTELLSL